MNKIESLAGKLTRSELFKPIHPPGTLENNLAPEDFKGLVDPKEAAQAVAAYKAEQDRIENGRKNLAPAETMLSIDELEVGGF